MPKMPQPIIRALLGATALIVAAGHAACSTHSEGTVDEPQEADATHAEISSVAQSPVKRQSIGNCWIYATLGWAESLHKARTGQDVNFSESYLTFWDWYTKITSGNGYDSTTTRVDGAERTVRTVRTGGSWQLGVRLISSRGLMLEGDFLPEEAQLEMSARQASAAEAMKTALSDGGELGTATARRDGALVFSVLTTAWGLEPQVVASLRAVFGDAGYRRFDSYANPARVGETRVLEPRAVSIQTPVRQRTATVRVDATLADVMPTARYAWRAYDFPHHSASPELRTIAMRRLLAALNSDAPVLVSWLVDFAALDPSGAFRLEQLRKAGRPGRQGGHLTVLHDYQVTLRDGRVLPVGTPASAADRASALDGTLQFLRVKNSWGVSRSDRASVAGYYDLYTDYLNGPIDWVIEGGSPPTSPLSPLQEFVVPAGF